MSMLCLSDANKKKKKQNTHTHTFSALIKGIEFGFLQCSGQTHILTDERNVTKYRWKFFIVKTKNSSSYT